MTVWLLTLIRIKPLNVINSSVFREVPDEINVIWDVNMLIKVKWRGKVSVNRGSWFIWVSYWLSYSSSNAYLCHVNSLDSVYWFMSHTMTTLHNMQETKMIRISIMPAVVIVTYRRSSAYIIISNDSKDGLIVWFRGFIDYRRQ